MPCFRSRSQAKPASCLRDVPKVAPCPAPPWRAAERAEAGRDACSLIGGCCLGWEAHGKQQAGRVKQSRAKFWLSIFRRGDSEGDRAIRAWGQPRRRLRSQRASLFVEFPPSLDLCDLINC